MATAVQAGGNGDINQHIEYSYSAIISDVSSSKRVALIVENKGSEAEKLKTTISGVNANFSSGGNKLVYTLPANSERRFQVQVKPVSMGDKSLEFTTENTDLGLNRSTSLPVLVREYPVVAATKDTPGLTPIYLAALTLFASVVYFTRI